MMSTALSRVEGGKLSRAAAGSTASEKPWAYSLDKAAELLGISKMSVRRAIARGELEAVKFGSLTRIMADELRRYTKKVRRAKFGKPKKT